ncbi:CRISPR-associated protein Csx19 [Corynebacterium sp. ES2794-CONJ1]|uniref:type III-D CRISPR-associated protein Csx19 n=1 Tax=Corynebacterium sp. ES2794-CONJ1 TaxID=2980553 RepID=UPI0021D902F9|nr:CRISPR-associated protein Csx19 [Corynebacterium sp. ES2794-CONJ1]MCU9518925.1 CRISPR-associated protein Csx19 [Corynebacterium sp. ES2794-CONJ1]
MSTNNDAVFLTRLASQAHAEGCQTGWLYTPRSAYFIRAGVNGWVRLAETPSYEEVEEEFNTALEAVFFNEELQHHWIRERDQQGRVMSIHNTSSEKYVDRDLILWGKVAPDAAVESLGWTKLTSARIGSLCVPVESQKGADYISLRHRHYLSEDDEGNAYLSARKYLALRPLASTHIPER